MQAGRLRRLLTVATLATGVVGCSSSIVSEAVVSMFRSEEPTTHLETVSGDKYIEARIGTENGEIHYTADTIVVQESNYFMVFLLILGWVLSHLGDMYQEIKSWFRR